MTTFFQDTEQACPCLRGEINCNQGRNCPIRELDTEEQEAAVSFSPWWILAPMAIVMLAGVAGGLGFLWATIGRALQ